MFVVCCLLFVCFLGGGHPQLIYPLIHRYANCYVPTVINVTVAVDGSTEFEVDEEVGSDVMVVVSVSSEDTSELADDLMVMVNISSGAADTASECVMSSALQIKLALEHTNAESAHFSNIPWAEGRGGGGGPEM